MRFGLFLMPEPFPWSNWTLSYDLKLEEIVKAEHLTYDEVWVGEHHTGAYENIPAPDIFIAKATAISQKSQSEIAAYNASLQSLIAASNFYLQKLAEDHKTHIARATGITQIATSAAGIYGRQAEASLSGMKTIASHLVTESA